MDKREHTLAPQWLKSNGSTGGGGNAVQNTASSTLHSDDHAATLPSRSRLHMSNGDHDSYRSSSFMDRTSSSYSRRTNNCNGSMMHEKDSLGQLRSYSSFERSNRDRYREKNFRDYRDKERSVIGDYRDRDYTDHLSSDLLINRSEKDKLRRSQSLISGKQAEVWPKRAATDSSCSSNNSNSLSHHNTLGVGASTVGNTHKVISERDFPSLGTVEKQGAFDAERVSTGLNTAVQMLPISTTAAIGGIGWTSALAEVPTLKESNSAGPLSVQQTTPAMSATVAPITTTGLNMAETLAQAPSRARTAPQISVENQRLEELAIKQSRQLIPKTLVLNAEKLKPKAAIRNEITTTTKNGNQQISSHLVNLSPRGGPVRSDVKTLHGGKLLVLKGPLEKNGNSLASATNDLLSSTNHCKLLTNIPSIASATSARPRSPNIQKLTVVERKPYLPGTNSSSADKKPIVSQTQSRNDFFDLVRKKTSTPASSSPAEPNSISCSSELIIEVVNTSSGPSSDGDVHDESQHHLAPIEFVYSDEKEVVNAPSGPSSDGDAHDEPHHHLAPIGFVYSDEKEVEKEVAFLRLLGWNETEEETITAEEIDDFNKRYTEFRSSVKQCRDPELQQEKLRVVMLKSRASSLDNTSSECSSSDSDSDDSNV